MQMTTQSGGLRPFGVSILVAGIDETGMKLFETDPTGIFFQYKATVIGEGEVEIEKILHKEYADNISMEEALKLGIKSLIRTMDETLDVERIDAAIISLADKKFERVSTEKIAKIFGMYKGKPKA
jgi:proteasome alpha subunit